MRRYSSTRQCWTTREVAGDHVSVKDSAQPTDDGEYQHADHDKHEAVERVGGEVGREPFAQTLEWAVEGFDDQVGQCFLLFEQEGEDGVHEPEAGPKGHRHQREPDAGQREQTLIAQHGFG